MNIAVNTVPHVGIDEPTVGHGDVELGRQRVGLCRQAHQRQEVGRIKIGTGIGIRASAHVGSEGHVLKRSEHRQ